MALIPRAFGSNVLDPFFGGRTFDPFDSFSRSLFDRAFPSLDKDLSSVANTRVDWVETPEAHVLKADLPGMNKDEIKVQMSDDGTLSISGERHKEVVDETDSYRREERSYGKFFRQFKLPSDSKTEEISAKVNNGVLTVTVPKSEKKTPQIQNIEISS